MEADKRALHKHILLIPYFFCYEYGWIILEHFPDSSDGGTS